MNTLLTTENKTDINVIKDTYFNNQLPLEKYGQEADIIRFDISGLLLITINVTNADNATLLLFDNQEISEVKVKEGINQIYCQINSNSYGFILFPIDTKDVSTVNIEQINMIPSPTHPVSYWTIGDVNIDIINRVLTLSTNKGRPISIVGNELFNDRDYLQDYGVEASAFVLNNLPVGVYSFRVDLARKDSNENDLLLAYNGDKLIPITDVNTGAKTVELDVIYGYIYLIAIDSNKRSGITEFIISEVNRVRDLDFIPPQPISLIPDESLGRVIANRTSAIISSGTNSRSISTIISNLGLEEKEVSAYVQGELRQLENLSVSNFTEGSYAVWNLEEGQYQLKWRLKTTDKINFDSVYLYNGETLELLTTTESATTQYSTTQWISPISNSEVRTQKSEVLEGDKENGLLAIIVLDAETKTSTTDFEILSLQKIEPRKSFLIDTAEGINTGEVNFSLGADFSVFRTLIKCDRAQQLTIEIDKPVIMEITNSDLEVVYNIEYVRGLVISLEAGEYALNLYTESSIEEDYQLNISTVDFNEFEPIYSEPPYPIAPTLRNLGDDFATAFDFGVLKPWESDGNTGKTWQMGYVYPTAHLGHSTIENKIKEGEIDVCTFTLEETSYLNLFYRGVMVTILDENGILTSSNNNETGQLQVQLETGKYYLQFVTNNPELSTYSVSIYLSNSDPNYAD